MLAIIKNDLIPEAVSGQDLYYKDRSKTETILKLKEKPNFFLDLNEDNVNRHQILALYRDMEPEKRFLRYGSDKEKFGHVKAISNIYNNDDYESQSETGTFISLGVIGVSKYGMNNLINEKPDSFEDKVNWRNS